MLSLMPFTPSYAIFYAIYPKLCYLLCHIPRSSAIFFLNVMLQYITLTPSYANSSYAMFSGQSRVGISGYCCTSLVESFKISEIGFKLIERFFFPGHAFLLIWNNLFILEEAKAYLGWERIKDMLRNEEHKRSAIICHWWVEFEFDLRLFTTHFSDKVLLTLCNRLLRTLTLLL